MAFCRIRTKGAAETKSLGIGVRFSANIISAPRGSDSTRDRQFAISARNRQIKVRAKDGEA